MNAGQVLSIGVFFTLMIIGLAISLPHTMETGLIGQGLSRFPWLGPRRSER